MSSNIIHVDLVHASGTRAYVEEKLKPYRVAVVTDEENHPVLVHDGQNIRELAYSDGSFQPLDADLTAIAGITGPGLLVKTTTDPTAPVWAVRTLQAGAGITITGGDGISGNPQITCTITQYTDGLAVAGIKNDSAWHATDWDAMYLWGDHHSMGYITSIGPFVETDPFFVASVSYGITQPSIDSWDIAYGWGDHNYPVIYMRSDTYFDLGAIETLTGTGILGRWANSGYGSINWVLSPITDSYIPVTNRLVGIWSSGIIINSLISQVSPFIGIAQAVPETHFHISENSYYKDIMVANSGALLIHNRYVGAGAGAGVSLEIGDEEKIVNIGIRSQSNTLDFNCVSSSVAIMNYLPGSGSVLTINPTLNLRTFYLIGGTYGELCEFDMVTLSFTFLEDKIVSFGNSATNPDLTIMASGVMGRIKSNLPDVSQIASLEVGELYTEFEGEYIHGSPMKRVNMK